MASPTDKSFKVITATIQSILKWKEYGDKVALLYESFGKNMTLLFSQNSLSPSALSLRYPWRLKLLSMIITITSSTVTKTGKHMQNFRRKEVKPTEIW